ncbi:DUF1194 domain-containing protein [Rhodobacter sp. NSM]|uniref:DUF1194 domain-containing protein n=1 Tax=Rhodobacter sp. NSM TaxID=3457501 RepID=UPI003FD0AA50
MSRTAASALLAFALASAPACASDCADLALVLAIDSSLSIDAEEFALQIGGYASAFRSPRVQAALAAAGVVDVAAVVWSDAEVPPLTLGWMRIAGQADAGDVAGRLAELGRPSSGRTGVGAGLAAAIGMLDGHGCAGRLVVNISGDGRERLAPRSGRHGQLPEARRQAEERGVIVNALAVADEEEGLPEWYRTHVVAGPGSFVMETADFEGFAEAVALKLAREIAPPRIADAHPVPRPPSPQTGGKRPDLVQANGGGAMRTRYAAALRTAS